MSADSFVSRRRDGHRILLSLLGLLALGCGRGPEESTVVELHGAGATFPAPLYERWFRELTRRRSDLVIRYDAVGSGAGIQQFTEELADFGASDEALSDEAIAQVDRGVRLLPMTSGGIVLAFNLSDTAGQPITDLRLSRKAYIDIFLGKISRWNDDEIARHNPGAALPDMPIQVEYRLDASGTTLAFTRHLAAVSDEWQAGPGEGKRIIWPVGAGMPGDAGVRRAIGRVPGSIGYLSYAFAARENVPMAHLENRAGTFVKPTLETLQTALGGITQVPDDLRMSNVDPDGDQAYPIVTYSWILCYRTYDDPSKLQALKEVLTYCLTDGQQFSNELGYIPLPDEITRRAREALESISLPLSADAATLAAPAPVSEAAANPVAEPITRADLASPDGPPDESVSEEDESLDDVSVSDAAAEQAKTEEGKTQEGKTEQGETEQGETPPAETPPAETDSSDRSPESEVPAESPGVGDESPERPAASESPERPAASEGQAEPERAESPTA